MKTIHMQFTTMKNKVIRFSKENKYILITISIFSLYLIYNFIILDKNFAWYNDQQFQHNVFYKEWYRIIEESVNNARPSFYSWNTFLGTDFFTSKLLYCVGDFILTPLFIIFAIFNINFDFNTLYILETIICIYISGLAMNSFLKKFGIKNNYITNTFSIIYAFSGFIVTYMGTYMFHRFYALMPLLFYYIEIYLTENKKSGFSFIVAILFMQNYELMYSVSLFLIVYFLFSYKLKNSGKTIDGIKKAIPLIFSYIVGLMISGVALIPLVMFIKSNPRVGSMDYGNLFWDFKTIMGFLINIICPSFNFRSDNPPYLFYTNQHFSAEYGIFATTIIIIAIIILVKKADKKDKKLFLTVNIITLLFVLIRPLNMVAHGFSEPTLRWSFVIMFFNILMSAYILEKYNFSFKEISKYVMFVFLIYFVLIFVYVYIYRISFGKFLPNLIIYVLSFVITFVYLYLISKIKYTKLIILVFLNLSLFNIEMINGNKNYQYNIKTFNAEYLNYFITNDETKMFRYYFNPNEIQPFSNINLNSSMEYDYFSVQTYDSTYDNATYNYLKWNGYDSWILDINKMEMLKMLGVKYIGTLNNFDSNNELEYAYNLDDLKVYKIKEYNNLGHTYSEFTTTKPDKDFDYVNELYVNEEDINKLNDIKYQSKKQMEVIEFNRQYMLSNIDVEEKCVLFVGVPYNNGWNIMNQDGDKIEYINVQGGFMGLIVDENDKQLSFYYGTPGLKLGLIVSLVGIVFNIFQHINEKRKIV